MIRISAGERGAFVKDDDDMREVRLIISRNIDEEEKLSNDHNSKSRIR